MGNVYGYARVSTREQKEDRQILALTQIEIPMNQIFVDKQSGKNFQRPMYQRLLRKMKENDLLYVRKVLR